MTTLTLPDVETLVTAFLRPRLDVPVATRIPRDRPEEFIRAWRTGGAAQSRAVDVALITVQSWAADTVRAAHLAGQARDELLGAAHADALPLVRAVEDIGGLYYDPDPDTGTDRYSVTLRLVVRGTTATYR